MWRGYKFSSMSDSFLLESYDELSVLTDESKDNSDNYMSQWRACKDELVSRLKQAQQLQEEQAGEDL